jgi:hypothetical protein
MTRSTDDTPKIVKVRHIGNGLKADPAYGEDVAKALVIPLNKEEAATSSEGRLRTHDYPTLEGGVQGHAKVGKILQHFVTRMPGRI